MYVMSSDAMGELPFDDVRLYATDIEHVSNDEANEPDIWLPLNRWLSLHPAYMNEWHGTIDILLNADGPLNHSHRYYVAVMAASRHSISYILRSLMSRLSATVRENNVPLDAYLRRQTDRYTPLKQLNRILAHRPWAVSAQHIVPLCRVVTSASSVAQWSMPELIHAVVILVHVHALCSFVAGCGIHIDDDGEIDEHASQTFNTGTNGHSDNNGHSGIDSGNVADRQTGSGEVQTLMQRMAEIKRLQESGEPTTVEQIGQTFTEILGEERRPKSAAHSPTTRSPPPPDDSPEHDETSQLLSQLMRKGDTFTYMDFAMREDKQLAPTLKIHDYSWEAHGYGLIAQSMQPLADTLDAKFRLIQQLTYNTLAGHTGQDTVEYRRAIWTYTQSLFGIRHDDYDYSIVNKLLSRPLKTFVKMVACQPERVSESTRRSVMHGFKYSETIHVILLVSEARLQAELLYFLRATNRSLV